MKTRGWWLIAAAVPPLAMLGWAGFAPIRQPTREAVFEIPRGTWARRMAGDKVEILPSRITLTLGVSDILLVRNLDDVPQTFGPALLMPGQTFTLPFEVESENEFACTAHASGQLKVIVEAEPFWQWQKIRWRLSHWRETR
jgi:hypothetical protein